MNMDKILRPDVVDKSLGKAKFTSDIQLQGMLYGKILRSPYAHARIKNINVKKAKSMPGVMGVITGKDYDEIGQDYGAVMSDERALHSDKVRYYGDEVAAVAATTEEYAIAALKAIEVQYEVLPAVLDMGKALEPGAPLIHEGLQSNVKKHVLLNVGDVEKAKKESYYIATGEYATSRQQHVPFETHCAVVDFNVYSNRITIWTSAQIPSVTRLKMAKLFKIPESNIRVISEYVGGGFGSKCDSFSSTDICAAMLSRITTQPVKIVNTREEETMATRTRHAMKRNIWIGFDKEGMIQFIQEKVLVDNGAYTSFGPGVMWLSAVTAIGPYKVGSVRIDADLVYTNHAPGGAMRGFGNPQSTFARESLLDEAAQALGINPLELRLRNVIKDTDTPYVNATRQIIDTFGIESCLRAVADKIGYSNKKAHEGIGFAAMIHWSTSRWEGMEDADNSNATVTVNDDGTVIAHLGYTEIGQGAHMAFRKILADVLKVDPCEIRIVQSDTEHTPLCQGTFASRGAVVAGSALKLAALDAKDQLLEAASHYFKVPKETISLEGGGIFVCKEDPLKQLSLKKLAEKIYFSRETGPARMVIGKGSWDAETEILGTDGGHYAPTYACSATAVRVSVDIETGNVTVLDIVSAHDVGMILDLGGIEAQIHGGIVQGLGYALYEDMVYDEKGILMNPSFQDYIIPTIADAPQKMVGIAIESGVVPTVPSGVKGVGDAAMVCIAPAIANAIASVSGARVRSLPITPEKILASLRLY
ncbi:MAG: xanthine dehydrogenase family protein molybdopterin-binding subunit [Candidatus Humimicrobiaceae bacterium]